MDAHLNVSSVVHPVAAKQWQEFTNRNVPEPPQVNRETRKFGSIEEAAAATGKPVDPQLAHLFVQPRFEQRTPEWHTARNSAITASDFGAAAGFAEYGSPVQVYRKKIETAPQVFSDFAKQCMAHGTFYEDAATFRYEQETGNTVLDFGLLTHWRLWQMKPPDVTAVEWFGMLHAESRPLSISERDWEIICDLRWLKGSPDGITTNGILLEFKCPVSAFVSGHVKKMYFAQVQLNMEIAGVDVCHFVQYSPQKTWLFGERYDLVEIRRDEGWFGVHKGKARKVWDWIQHTRATNELPPELADKYTIVRSSPPGEFELESSRKRSRPSPSVQEPKSTALQIALLPFPSEEREWAAPEVQSSIVEKEAATNDDDEENERLAIPALLLDEVPEQKGTTEPTEALPRRQINSVSPPRFDFSELL